KLARDLEAAGVPIIGTSPDSIDRAEDRERFQQMLHELKLRQAPNRTARTEEEALAGARQIGYPIVVRPSYVLGGRAMKIVHAESDLARYMRNAVKVSNDSPVLIDRFLNDATEVDVDAVSDGKQVIIGGIMEHIEQAGVHSGDSACSLPPFSLSQSLQEELRRQTVAMARALNVVGLMNVLFAIQFDDGRASVYVLEVNPRASRTVPYVSKATGRPLAKIAATRGTATALAGAGVPVTPVNKVAEGRPHIVDMMKNDEISLVVNTVEEKRSAIHDSYVIRRAALNDQIPTYTTLAGARAAAVGLSGMRGLVPYAIQTLHQRLQ